MNALELISVSKNYSDNKVLKDISFSLEKGKIYGLVGKNGAGKTTIFKIIRQIITNYSGEVKVYGDNVRYNNSFLEHSYFLPAEPVVIGKVKNFFKLFDLQENYVHSSIAEKTSFFKKNLEDKKDQYFFFLSTGWKKAVFIEKLLRMKKVDFLFLDEPFEGLDIDFRFILTERIKKLVDEGATVLISSHNFFDLQNLTKNIIIIDKGSVKFNEETDDIRKVWYEHVAD